MNVTCFCLLLLSFLEVCGSSAGQPFPQNCPRERSRSRDGARGLPACSGRGGRASERSRSRDKGEPADTRYQGRRPGRSGSFSGEPGDEVRHLPNQDAADVSSQDGTGGAESSSVGNPGRPGTPVSEEGTLVGLFGRLRLGNPDRDSATWTQATAELERVHAAAAAESSELVHPDANLDAGH